MKTASLVDYEVEGDFPKYGNDDDRVDSLAVIIVVQIHAGYLRQHYTYSREYPNTVNSYNYIQRSIW